MLRVAPISTNTIRRLMRDHPKLVERVKAGELSANAAAIEAGFRKVKTPLERIELSANAATACLGDPNLAFEAKRDQSIVFSIWTRNWISWGVLVANHD